MKNKLIETKEVKRYLIDYENGLFCEVKIENGELYHYHFYSDKYENHLNYFTNKEIEYIKNTFWSDVRLDHKPKFNTIEELENFKDFENVCYFGGGMDGMFRTYKGEPISTPILLDDTFCKIYLDIETSKKECEEILNTLNKKWILNSLIYLIPYYNQNEDREEHYTLHLEIKLSDEDYKNILGDKNYVDDDVRKEIFKFIQL